MWVPGFSSDTSQGWRPSNLLKKAASGSLAIANYTKKIKHSNGLECIYCHLS